MLTSDNVVAGSRRSLSGTHDECRVTGPIDHRALVIAPAAGTAAVTLTGLELRCFYTAVGPGGAVAVLKGAVSFVDDSFVGNVAVGGGGALVVMDSATSVSFEAVSFSHNTATEGHAHLELADGPAYSNLGGNTFDDASQNGADTGAAWPAVESSSSKLSGPAIGGIVAGAVGAVIVVGAVMWWRGRSRRSGRGRAVEMGDVSNVRAFIKL